MAQPHWHSLPLEEVLAFLRADPVKGLSAREAARRLEISGPNAIREARAPSPLQIFLSQFTDFMVLVLLGATAVSYVLGEVLDAVAIVAIVILNAVLGFVQEFRAERSLQTLRRLSAPLARVLRNGQVERIPSRELVPGDFIFLKAGDVVPADARLFEAAGLEAEESALTGESVPTSKTAEFQGKENLPLGDQKNMLFQGTIITRGRGKALVVATGVHTQMGTIAEMIEDSGEARTPLQERLDQLGKILVVICVLVSGLVAVSGLLRGEPAIRMFMAGVSLAVAAIPEGLPAVVTIALALGVQRLIRVNALIRKLPAVETLGCATVICSDKTDISIYSN